MAALNPLTRELVFKIVFYGPGLGGKTTTLQTIHARTKPEFRGKMVSLATPTDRTLYFDFLPLRLPKVRNLSVRLQLFTVPGQVYFTATRKLVLTGADGIVFVADSQNARMDANQESLDDLNGNLAEHGRSLSQTPHAFQWNKRDLADVATVEELDRRFNLFAAPATGTVATSGEGVFDALDKITQLVLENYKAQMPRGSGAMPMLDAEDSGLEVAVRGLAESPLPRPLPAPVERTPAPPSTRSPESRPLPAPPPVHRDGPASTRAVADLGSTPAVEPSEPGGRGVSFVTLWPESERADVRAVEAELARGSWGAAVLRCDVVVARTLAAAASLAGGAAEAPRDPGLVAVLLGIEGPAYLRFRQLVRAARSLLPLDEADALRAYHFTLDVRRARAALAT
jgi:signal recognition particle receptor subunit beta